MPDFRQRLIMLKPMRPGVSGYARLQAEGSGMLVQLNARGLDAGAAQAYWYGAGGEARLIGAARVNAHGEISLMAEAPQEGLAPERLQAILLLSGGEEPSPLLIGMCAQQSAGNLLDAKNAAMSLCERLARTARAKRRESGPPRGGAGHAEALAAAQALSAHDANPARRNPDQRPAASNTKPDAPYPGRKAEKTRGAELPKEIFLPAIDPLPYVTAAQRAVSNKEPSGGAAPRERPSQSGAAPRESTAQTKNAASRGANGRRPALRARAADRLRPLVWPRGFETLKPFFAKGMPVRLFELPGWRFVSAGQAGGPDGLWVGIQQTDGRVRRVAYAHRGETPPPGGRPYRPARGLDGQMYQVLWQRV